MANLLIGLLRTFSWAPKKRSLLLDCSFRDPVGGLVFVLHLCSGIQRLAGDLAALRILTMSTLDLSASESLTMTLLRLSLSSMIAFVVCLNNKICKGRVDKS